MKPVKLNSGDFFKLLFSGKGLDDFWIERRYSLSNGFSGSQVERSWSLIRDIDTWLSDAEKIMNIRPHNVHYGLTAKKEPSGKKTDVGGFVCFWADIDDMNVNYFLRKNMENLRKIKMTPTVVASSGWGTHVYWIFGDGVKALDAEFIIEFEKKNRFLSWLIAGDSQACDAAHLLRFPGSYNCKRSPFRKTEAFLTGKVFDYEDLSLRIEETADSFMENCSIETQNEIIGIFRNKKFTLRHPADPGNRNIEDFPEPELNSILVGLQKQGGNCPFLHKALFIPSKLSYNGWFVLGCALNIGLGKRNGWYLFRTISALDTIRYNETDCFRMWNNIVRNNYIPASCSNGKVPDSLPCENLNKKLCKNIMSKIYKAIKNR